MERTSSLKNTFKVVLGIFAFALAFMFAKTAYADPTDYLENYYSGHVDSASGTDLYTEPGTVHEKVKDANGDPIHLDDGTTFYIYGEERDDDLDVWYTAKVEIDGVTYEGYVFTGRAKRDATITFTPTPIPEPTNTPTIAPEIESDVVATAAEASADTKKMVADSNTFEPWKWMIVLFIAIILFMLIYTIWIKRSEEKLEREMELYGGKDDYTPLDGESEEDFESARASYLDSIGLGNAGDGDNIPVADDYSEYSEYDNYDFNSNADTQVSGSQLSDLISSLQNKLGEEGDYDENYDDVVDEPDFTFDEMEGEGNYDENAPEDGEFGYDDPDARYDEYGEELPEEEYFDDENGEYYDEEQEGELFDEENGQYYDDAPQDEYFDDAPQEEEFTEPEPAPAPKIEIPAAPATPLKPTVPVGFSDEEGAIRSKSLISGLPQGSKIVHAMYGEGTILDNSDPDIIKVKFGEDTRYLKKSKLAKAGLIRF
ncbi:MAG: hypothetical protein K5848_00350 [Lachnospiraceae bacterium]|nr:hypothetical protein [Lachnospiraceae bacterium]